MTADLFFLTLNTLNTLLCLVKHSMQCVFQLHLAVMVNSGIIPSLTNELFAADGGWIAAEML